MRLRNPGSEKRLAQTTSPLPDTRCASLCPWTASILHPYLSREHWIPFPRAARRRPSPQRRRIVASTDTMTVAGAFDDPGKARHAVDELLRAGFTHEQIGWIQKDGGAVQSPVHADTAPEQGA